VEASSVFRSSLLTVAIVSCLLGSRADGATGVSRATLRCRRLVAKSLASFIETGLDRLSRCHTAGTRGNDCNVLGGLPAFERARERAKGIVKEACTTDDPVLGNFPDLGGDIVNPTAPVIQRRLEESGRALQGVTRIPHDRAARRCTRTIGRARREIIGGMLNHAIRCEGAIDASATVLGEVAGACVDDASKSTARWGGRIAKACRGVASASIGTCGPLPDCVLTSVVATGQDLVRGIYGGQGDLCGNGELDAGEDCDDGNRVDDDACTNQCHVAQCGDGVVETGVEECDDGNHDETDGCTPLCKLARCGDGIVEKGVEECDDGDANGTAEDLCQADCTFPKIACAPSGRIVLVATLVPKKDHSTFTDPKGLTLSLGYPSGLSLPGTGSLAPDDPSDPAAHIVLLDPDLYNGLVVFNDSDTILKTAVAGTDTFSLSNAFPFERVSFDCTAGELFSAGQFSCTVTDESDKLGGTISESRRPDCSAALVPAP
jgi:cysteine-rich repeat protein